MKTVGKIKQGNLVAENTSVVAEGRGAKGAIPQFEIATLYSQPISDKDATAIKPEIGVSQILISNGVDKKEKGGHFPGA